MADVKQNNSILYLLSVGRGGIINNDRLALIIAESIIGDVYGLEELEKQRPFLVDEQEGEWVITGSHQEVFEDHRRGPVKIRMARRDCQILDIVHPIVFMSAK